MSWSYIPDHQDLEFCLSGEVVLSLGWDGRWVGCCWDDCWGADLAMSQLVHPAGLDKSYLVGCNTRGSWLPLDWTGVKLRKSGFMGQGVMLAPVKSCWRIGGSFRHTMDNPAYREEEDRSPLFNQPSFQTNFWLYHELIELFVIPWDSLRFLDNIAPVGRNRQRKSKSERLCILYIWEWNPIARGHSVHHGWRLLTVWGRCREYIVYIC